MRHPYHTVPSSHHLITAPYHHHATAVRHLGDNQAAATPLHRTSLPHSASTTTNHPNTAESSRNTSKTPRRHLGGSNTSIPPYSAFLLIIIMTMTIILVPSGHTHAGCTPTPVLSVYLTALVVLPRHSLLPSRLHSPCSCSSSSCSCSLFSSISASLISSASNQY
jgi:hypothetical protein